jgi:hypothetical protein
MTGSTSQPTTLDDVMRMVGRPKLPNEQAQPAQQPRPNSNPSNTSIVDVEDNFDMTLEDNVLFWRLWKVVECIASSIILGFMGYAVYTEYANNLKKPGNLVPLDVLLVIHRFIITQ